MLWGRLQPASGRCPHRGRAFAKLRRSDAPHRTRSIVLLLCILYIVVSSHCISSWLACKVYKTSFVRNCAWVAFGGSREHVYSWTTLQSLSIFISKPCAKSTESRCAESNYRSPRLYATYGSRRSWHKCCKWIGSDPANPSRRLQEFPCLVAALVGTTLHRDFTMARIRTGAGVRIIEDGDRCWSCSYGLDIKWCRIRGTSGVPCRSSITKQW